LIKSSDCADQRKKEKDAWKLAEQFVWQISQDLSAKLGSVLVSVRATEEFMQIVGKHLQVTSAMLPSNIFGDAPIRLSVAAKLAFPDGSMTASGLRREAARGRLLVERIAGKDYTTL
jgi:hypothetical protein